MSKSISISQIAILIITLISSVAGFFGLPDSVAVQWNGAGASNYLPRYAAILVPVGVCMLCLALWRSSDAKFNVYIQASKAFRVAHWLVWGALSCVGILMNVSFLAMN